MCDCRKSLESDEAGKIKEFITKHHKATIKSMSFKEIAFPISQSERNGLKLRCVTYSTLEVQTNEKKKPIKVEILHSFCPFCGMKYTEEAA